MLITRFSILLLLILAWLMPVAYAAKGDPCTNFLALVNRPSVGDSPCVVPYEKAILETGYEYLTLRGGGHGQDYPQAVFRVGLPAKNEIVAILPNYNIQSVKPRRGFNASQVGVKHEFGYNDFWIGSGEVYLILPSGGPNFGSEHAGVTVNGIVAYSFNDALALTLMLGLTSQTLPKSQGGDRFQSLNPDLLLAYQFGQAAQYSVYAELFGQTNAGPGLGSGWDGDIGFLYTPLPYLELDIVTGRKISGDLNTYSNYIGAGFSILFG